MTVVITMASGEKHHAAGYPSQVAEAINKALEAEDDRLIPIEADVVPTGQKFWIDPYCVESVKDRR